MRGGVVAGLFISACASMGCSTFQQRSAPDWPWDPKASVCAQKPCSAEDSLSALSKASSFCRRVQNFYESGGRRAGDLNLMVGVVGTMAGILAPAASSTGTQVLSGLSASGNALQAAIDDAYNTTLNDKRRASVVDAGHDYMLLYLREIDETKRVSYAIVMAYRCAVASALVDVAAAKAVADMQVPKQPLPDK
jgi:hypothetical protein